MGVTTTGRCQDDYDDNGMDLYDDYDEAMRGSLDSWRTLPVKTLEV